MSETQSKVQEPLWTKPFLLVVLVNFLMFSSMYLLLPTLPVYAQKIGGSEAVAGLIVGLFTLSSVAVRPWFGNMLDLKGRKIVLNIGIVIFLLAAFSYAWIPVIGLLLVTRIVHGIGWGATTTAAGTVASDIIPAARRGEGMGYYGISTTLAMSVGPYLGLSIIDKFSFPILFYVSFAIAVLGFLAAQFINYEGIKGHQVQERPKGVIIEKTAVPPALVLFFTALTYGGIVTFLKQYADFRGVENIGLFFTVYAIVLFISRPIMGKMADKHGPGKVLVPGMFLIAGALLSLIAAKNLPVFLLAGILYGVGFGAVQPVLNAVTINLAPVQRRGAANATFFSAMDLGIGLGAMILGVISQNMGYSFMYGSSVIFIVIALILYFAVLRGKLEIREDKK